MNKKDLMLGCNNLEESIEYVRTLINNKYKNKLIDKWEKRRNRK